MIRLHADVILIPPTVCVATFLTPDKSPLEEATDFVLHVARAGQFVYAAGAPVSIACWEMNDDQTGIPTEDRRPSAPQQQ
jgi:hypothetical protein